MRGGGFRFRRFERLAGKAAVGKVFRRGRSFGTAGISQDGGSVQGHSGVKLFVLKNGFNYNRICFTFPRKFGNAVERNRARRLSREAYRQMRPRLKGGFDLVLLVYPPCKSETFLTRTGQLAALFAKAGLFMETRE